MFMKIEYVMSIMQSICHKFEAEYETNRKRSFQVREEIIYGDGRNLQVGSTNIQDSVKCPADTDGDYTKYILTS